MKTAVKLGVAALSILSTALTVPSAAAKGEPLLLPPTSKWNVHYADDYCRLARTFGTGDDAITIFMDRFSPSATFRLNLIGPPMKRWVADGTARIRFGHGLPEQSLYFYVGSFDDKVPSWSFSTGIGLRPLPENAEDREVFAALPSFKADLEKANGIAIGAPLRKPVILQTGPMKKPFDALHACTEQLVASWGVDVESHRSAQRMPEPVGAPENWLRNYDYPEEMIRQRQPGLVEFRLMVDTAGKATACHIQQSTNPKGFNEVVCAALMRRAEFKPALDKDGRPMASYYRNRVRFHM